MTNPDSNPVGYLQEFVQRINVAPFPKYVESGASGPSHSRLFSCQCLYHGYESSGSGSTKKQAKTEASKNMIKLLRESGYFENYKDNIGDNGLTETKNVTVVVHPKGNLECNKNPISLLQEYCQQIKTQLPIYVETGNLGGHFMYECRMADEKTSGGGTCKKSAKNEAAYKMCQLLNLLPDHTNIQIKGSRDHDADKYEILREPLPVLNITSAMNGLILNDETTNGATAESMRFNDSLVEIEQNTSMNGSQKIKVEAPEQQISNPISQLQEYCQKNRIVLPQYIDGGKAGDIFLSECILGNKRTYGEGRCKKSSKTDAAFKMCKILKLFNIIEEQPNELMNERCINNETNRYTGKICSTTYDRVSASFSRPERIYKLEDFKLDEDEP